MIILHCLPVFFKGFNYLFATFIVSWLIAIIYKLVGGNV